MFRTETAQQKLQWQEKIFNEVDPSPLFRLPKGNCPSPSHGFRALDLRQQLLSVSSKPPPGPHLADPRGSKLLNGGTKETHSQVQAHSGAHTRCTSCPFPHFDPK